MSIKEIMIGRIQDVREGMNSLRSSPYGYIFFWQEMCSLSDKELEKAWAEVQTAPKKGKPLIMPDDKMRALGDGDHSLASTKLFTVTAKVSKPRKTLDLDGFLAELCSRFKITDIKTVMELKEKHMLPGNPSLSKRVVENVRD